MNTPGPLSRAYQYNLCNNNYEIDLNVTQSKFTVSIAKKTTVPNKRYETFFSLDDLIAKSKWFRIFESIEEAFNEMCELFNESEFKLKEEYNFISFIFCPSLKSTDEIQLLIPEIEAKQEDKFTELCASVNQLSKSISVLEKKFHIIENNKDFKKYFTHVN